MFEAEITPEHGYKKMSWEKIDVVRKAAFLDCFSRKISAEKYGLKVSAWTPLQPIDSLIKELTLRGPLVVGGAFGQSAYIDQPFKMSQKLHQRDVYAWKPGAKRHIVTFSGHTILLVGAKKVQEKAFVYFIDPKDKSEPKDKSLQKLYMISYTNLTQYICDMHGRMKPDSLSEIGYGYYGNFQLK